MTEKARDGDVGAARKNDYSKAPIWQGFLNYFPRAAWAVAMVSEYGARKYGAYGNWANVPDFQPRYSDGHGRHLLKEAMGEIYDDGDSGLAHLAQDAWNALARLENAIRTGKVEVRVGNIIGADGKPQLGTSNKVELP